MRALLPFMTASMLLDLCLALAGSVLGCGGLPESSPPYGSRFVASIGDWFFRYGKAQNAGQWRPNRASRISTRIRMTTAASIMPARLLAASS